MALLRPHEVKKAVAYRSGSSTSTEPTSVTPPWIPAFAGKSIGAGQANFIASDAPGASVDSLTSLYSAPDPAEFG